MDSFKIRDNKVIYNGVEYDFDGLPKNVVFDGDIDIHNKSLSRLPYMSTWIVNGDFCCSRNDLNSLKRIAKDNGSSLFKIKDKLKKILKRNKFKLSC